MTETKAGNDIIQAEINRALALEKSLNEQLRLIKAAEEQIAATWSAVKEAMVDNNVKSIKGDFGSITVAERTSYKVDDAKLDDKFKKLAPDLKKIGTYTALMGEPPEGAEAVTTQYLTKRLK